ncbi:FG-GAP repeat domain-containing protein [Streptomyces lasalocidi]
MARHPDGKLWLYANTGFGAVDTENRQELGQFESQLDTSKIDQVAGAGDVSGDGYPDLLARVGDSVWLLVGHPAGFIDEAYPIADSGWARRTLIAPGDMTGDGPLDLLARDDADGRIYLYRGESDADTGGTVPSQPGQRHTRRVRGQKLADGQPPDDHRAGRRRRRRCHRPVGGHRRRPERRPPLLSDPARRLRRRRPGEGRLGLQGDRHDRLGADFPVHRQRAVLIPARQGVSAAARSVHVRSRLGDA